MSDPRPESAESSVADQDHEVTFLPEPDVPDPGEIDPADVYAEGVDRSGEAGN